MIPRRLLISGFLSYKEPVEIDFDEFDLACISGLNGAGKSSLLDALTWSLFGVARRRDDAIINLHVDMAEVEFDFDYEDISYRIIRKKQREGKSLLEFYIADEDLNWRPLTDRTMRGTEDFIAQTLRLDYETFVNASFFLQGKADQFAQQRSGDRKRILSNILGLEKWETYRQNVMNRRKEIEDSLSGLTGQIEEIDAELSLEDERREKLKTLNYNLENIKNIVAAEESNLENARLLNASLNEQKQYVDVLYEQYENTRNRLEEQKNQLVHRRTEWENLNERISESDLIEDSYKRWQEDKKSLEKLNELSEKFYVLDSKRQQLDLVIRNKMSLLKQEKGALIDTYAKIEENQRCLEEIHDLINEIRGQIEALKKNIEKNAGLELDLSNVENNIIELNSENKHLYKSMQLLNERIEKLSDPKIAECPLCGQDLEGDDRTSLLASLKDEGKVEGDKYRHNKVVLKELEKRKKDLSTELAELKRQQDDLQSHERELGQLTLKQEQIQKMTDEWQVSGKPRLDEINELLQDNYHVQSEQQELDKAVSTIKTLDYDTEIHKKVKNDELEGRQSETRMRELESAKAALEPLGREIAQLQKKIQSDETEILKYETLYKEAETKYNELKKSLPDINTLEVQLTQKKEQENTLRLQVGGANQAVEVLAHIRTRKENLQEKRISLQKEISKLKILERACSKDGVPALLIEQALPEIELQANNILDRLSSGNMSVRFETLKDYKDKKRQDKKETLDILINDSSGVREYEMFSGGEAFRINFAIRLALSRVLAHRAGARLQTLVIDEGFGSQDASGRQRLIEAINLVQRDFKKILVITHLEDLKDAFPARLEVEKNLSGSSVSLVV